LNAISCSGPDLVVANFDSPQSSFSSDHVRTLFSLCSVDEIDHGQVAISACPEFAPTGPGGSRPDRSLGCHGRAKNARRPVSRVLSPCGGWPFIWDVRCRTPRATYPGGDAKTRLASPKAGPPPLLGLAPGGVCRAASVAGRAVRSYRTLSPLPAEGRTPGPAVCFLWHFPWGCPRRVLPGTVFPWSPDFPPPPAAEAPGKGDHPAVWLLVARCLRCRRQAA